MKSRTKLILTGLLIFVFLPGVSLAKVSVASGLSYEKIAQAGSLYHGVIHLRNTDKEPQEVKVYQTDYLFSYDGKSIHGEPGMDPRSNAGWITFSPSRLTIPPLGTSQVNYTVQVPDDSALVGTYWSMIMVEGVASSSPESSNPQKDRMTVGLTQIIRYGLQIVTSIGDTGTRQLKFVNTKLLKTDDGRVLQIDIENTGERWLRASVWAELYNEKGVSIGKFTGGKARLYSTTSARFKIDLSQAPEGKYKALVVADCGNDDMFGATYTFEFK
jgi:hypothetical protein